MGRGAKRLMASVVGAALAALSVVSVALAGKAPTVSAYGGVAGAVQKNISGSTHSATHGATHVSGTLPFTGVNLALFAVAAVVLVGLGLGLRRVSSRV